MSGYSRRASHAATGGRGWYDASTGNLKALIDDLFAEVPSSALISSDANLRAIISPHAGISYSGPTAAHVYASMRQWLYGSRGAAVKRVFILGPSHHKGFDGVEISGASQYETPFGPIGIDSEAVAAVTSALKAAGVSVNKTTQRVDEEEHSIEMQIPFVSHTLHYPPPGRPSSSPAAVDRVRLVPIIVGWVDEEVEAKVAAALRTYFASPENLFILSSDFCHWGSRFRYTYHFNKAKYPQIGDAIIAMDKEGMRLLESRNIRDWYAYLDKTNNTICGRHPISIGMQFITGGDSNAVNSFNVAFKHYSQSNRCESTDDSSVSYAAAVITADA